MPWSKFGSEGLKTFTGRGQKSYRLCGHTMQSYTMQIIFPPLQVQWDQGGNCGMCPWRPQFKFLLAMKLTRWTWANCCLLTYSTPQGWLGNNICKMGKGIGIRIQVSSNTLTTLPQEQTYKRMFAILQGPIPSDATSLSISQAAHCIS